VSEESSSMKDSSEVTRVSSSRVSSSDVLSRSLWVRILGIVYWEYVIKKD
jgi:hypothetical protein